jgi:hypothetical protein
MVAEASRAIGYGGASLLPSQAEDLEPDLLPRTARGLRSFAELVEAQAR